MRFTPHGNRILVKPDEAAQMTPGGLHLPDAAKEKPRRGKIVAKGGGKVRDDGTLQCIVFDEGDVVYYQAYSGHKIEIEREEFLVLEADEILGTLS